MTTFTPESRAKDPAIIKEAQKVFRVTRWIGDGVFAFFVLAAIFIELVYL